MVLIVLFIVCLMLLFVDELIKCFVFGIDVCGMLFGVGGFVCLCIVFD